MMVHKSAQLEWLASTILIPNKQTGAPKGACLFGVLSQTGSVKQDLMPMENISCHL